MVAIHVSRSIAIDTDELEESFTRSSGPGGQHVNTTDSAVMLRFDVAGSPNLPDAVKHRLAAIAGSRMTREGVLVLRSEGSRSQLLNRQEVRERLVEMIQEALIVPKKRRPTRPTRASHARRVDTKAKRGAVKQARGKPRID
jgi:ribosome-associated protein